MKLMRCECACWGILNRCKLTIWMIDMSSADKECKTILDNIAEAIMQAEIVYDSEGKPVDWRILDINPAQESLSGILREKSVGQLAGNVYGTEVVQHFLALFSRVAATGTAVTTEVQSPFSKRQYMLHVFSTVKGKFTTAATDITEHKEKEESLRKLNRTQKALSAVSEAIIRATDESSLLHTACHILADIGGYRMAWVGYPEDDKDKRVRPECAAGFEEGFLDKVEITWSDTELGAGPTGKAIRSGKPTCACDLLTDPCYAPWREEALKRGYASMVAIPLVADGQTLGILDIYSNRTDAFDNEEVRLLTELCDDLAYGIMSLRNREERNRALEALRESERRYRRIVTAAQEGIWEFDTDCKIIFANQRMADMLGYTIDELLGTTIGDYMDAAAKKETDWHLQRCKKGITERFDLRFRRKDGSDLWAIMSSAPIVDDGKLTGTLGLVTDITGHKKAEREKIELEAHKREFYKRTILAATGGKLVITEPEHIKKIAGPAIACWDVKDAAGQRKVRQEIIEIAEPAGMDSTKLDDLILCAGEAMSNSIKYAGSGKVCLHHTLDGLMVVDSDQGPGIEALALPDVALKRGYTTAISLGMGYKEMLALADRVYLASGPKGTTLAIEVKLQVVEPLRELASLPETW